jgi:hypothetical protein
MITLWECILRPLLVGYGAYSLYRDIRWNICEYPKVKASIIAIKEEVAKLKRG